MTTYAEDNFEHTQPDPRHVERSEMQQNWPEIQKLSWIPEPERMKSFDTGIPGLTKHLRLPEKGLMTIVGPPSGGKSTLARRICFNLAKEHKLRIALTCLEEPVKHRTIDVFRKMWGGDFVNKLDAEQVMLADTFVDGRFWFITKPGHGLFNGWRLADMMVKMCEMDGAPDVFCCDPWNEVDHSWNRKEFSSKTDYVGHLLMEIKSIAEHFRKLVIICAHPPSEQIRRKRMGNFPEFYEISDAADSAHFYNKSDIGLGVWFNRNLNETIVNIDKVKDREMCGTISHPYPFVVSMRFDYSNEGYRVSREGWDEINGGDDA